MIVLKLFTDRWSGNYNYQAGAEHAPLEASGGWASSAQTTNPADQEKLLSPGERLGRPRNTPQPSNKFKAK